MKEKQNVKQEKKYIKGRGEVKQLEYYGTEIIRKINYCRAGGTPANLL